MDTKLSLQPAGKQKTVETGNDNSPDLKQDLFQNSKAEEMYHTYHVFRLPMLLIFMMKSHVRIWIPFASGELSSL